MKKFTATTLFNVLLVFLTACAPLAMPSAQSTPVPTQIVVRQFSHYATVTYPEMVAQAGAIWVGKVAGIGPTLWNQDSGEMWDNGMQLHYVHIEVLQPIVENIKLEGTVRVTVLGASPLDGYADHDLQVGEQAVFFARATQLAWRGGTKPIIELLGNPADSYLKMDGSNRYSGALRLGPIELDDLISEIERLRAENPQPTAEPLASPTPVPLISTP